MEDSKVFVGGFPRFQATLTASALDQQTGCLLLTENFGGVTVTYRATIEAAYVHQDDVEVCVGWLVDKDHQHIQQVF